VYRAFDSLEDFEAAIGELRDQREKRLDDESPGADGERGANDCGPGGTVEVPVPATAAD
jgi:transcriptional repressor NrdR